MATFAKPTAARLAYASRRSAGVQVIEMAVRFLSDEWLAEVERRLAAHEGFLQAARGQSARLQQEITGAPGGDRRYGFVLEDGKVSLVPGTLEAPDATLTQSYETAVAMAKQEITGQQAFMQGKLKVSGNLMKIMQLQGAFAAMPAALEGLEVDY
jgi:putative sterol carrier protein